LVFKPAGPLRASRRTENFGESRMTTLVLLAFLASSSASAPGADTAGPVVGRVVDSRTGQPIEKARVWTPADETVTDREGRFALPRPQDGTLELSVSAVGYGVARRTIGGDTEELQIRLGQDAVRYSETLDVQPLPFDREPDAPLARGLQNLELRNLSSVIADDALRSVQAMPGVSGNDDYYASFSVRGWGFEKAGLQIDGVLVSSPFHTIRDVNDGYSLSIVNNDVIAELTLFAGAAPARFGDRVGAALAIETRDGTRERTTGRASLGAAGASVFVEGPLGRSGTSWLFGARKSFLDYVVKAIQDQPSFVVGYQDVQAKLSHHSATHSFGLFVLHGDSDYEDGAPDLDPTDVAEAGAATQLASARWRWRPSARTSLAVGAFFSRETGVNRNRAGEPLFDGSTRQAGVRVDLSREWGAAHRLQAGVVARRLDGSAFDRLQSSSGPVRQEFEARRWQPGGHVQDTWRSASGRLTATLGLRVDAESLSDELLVLPRASASVALSSRTTLSAAAGSYAQFPNLEHLFGLAGNPDLLPERSDQLVLGLDHELSDTTRARVEIYHQDERQRLGRTTREPRIENGRAVIPEDGRYLNSGSGTSRGVELTLQRRSPNGLTGWLSYALAETRIDDAATGGSYFSDNDQRHTVNAYLSWRLSPRTNLSLRYRFGSNRPVAGYYEEAADGGYRLSERRNLLRLPAYSRLDLRANRTFAVGRARLTAFAEITNVTGHDNYRYTGIDIFLPSGRVDFEREVLFPLLPAAGLTIEW
jgi:hypothetical protein